MSIRVEVDGVGTVEFEDGTSGAVIDATVKRLVAQSPAAMDARLAQTQSAWAQNNPLRQLGNVARGGVDVIGGGAQLLARGANAMGLVPESNPDGFFAGPKDVEAQNTQARANVDNVFGKQQPGFTDKAVRAAAGGLLTMPLGPTRFLEAPTALGRAMGAGVGGAVAGGMQEVQAPKDDADFFKRKALQAGVGFASAALAQPIAEKVVSTVIAGLNAGADKAGAALRDVTGANSMDKLVGLTREALRKNGIDYDGLADDVKASLLTDVQKAMSAYTGINPGAVARQAAFRQEGFDPLRHWITRDPGDFTQMANLAKTDAGGPLKDRINALDGFVMDRMNGLRGPAPVPEEVGQAAWKDIGNWLNGEKGKTNVLYETFRQTAPNVTGNPQRFANDVFGGLEGQMAGAALPGPLREIVNKISAGEIPLTPSTLFQLQLMAKPGSDGTANFAIAHLRKSIDRELGAISSSVERPASAVAPAGVDVPGNEGAYAADVLKMARAQAAKTFGALDESKILRAVDENTFTPERFASDLLGGGVSMKELRSTWGKLTDGTQEQVRSQVMDQVRRVAFGAASDESGKAAAQATFNKYLADNGERLKVILGDETFGQLKRMGLMLEAAHLQPSGSAVNNSNTAGALFTLFPRVAEGMKAANVPGSSFVSNLARNGMVQNAQAVPADALGRASPMIDPFIEEILKRRTGHYAGLLGGAAGLPFAQGMFGAAP